MCIKLYDVKNQVLGKQLNQHLYLADGQVRSLLFHTDGYTQICPGHIMLMNGKMCLKILILGVVFESPPPCLFYYCSQSI